MQLWVRWVMACLATCLAVGILVWKRGSTPTGVPLSDGRELRVRKVSLGTNHVFSSEPIWKQMLRCALPKAWQKPLGPFQGYRFQTLHDSLVVYVSEFDVGAGRILPASFDQPVAMFPDGFVSRGRKRGAQHMVACFEFPCFARESRQVPLRVHHGSRPVTFTAPNPRPTRALAWQSQPLPQTNECRHTRIVLDGYHAGSGKIQAHVKGRALGSARMGWTSWSLTAFDPLGNWSENDSSWRPSLRAPPLPPSPTVKFLIEGQEYLSAGFVPHPTNGSWLALAPNLRSQDLGLRFLLVVGPGAYQMINGLVVRASGDSTGDSTRPLVLSSKAGPGTNWTLDLTTPVPGVLWLSDPHDAEVGLSARFRERIGADDGRIFAPAPGSRTISNPVKGSKLVASFIGSRLPKSTTNLEVEIIASLPAAEFIVKH